ncbi:hypothetical protein Q8A73_006082 [Channa argus]|nr:hypothetical protein Q8A73_006082 [Channa argus]
MSLGSGVLTQALDVFTQAVEHEPGQGRINPGPGYFYPGWGYITGRYKQHWALVSIFLEAPEIPSTSCSSVFWNLLRFTWTRLLPPQRPIGREQSVLARYWPT